MSDDALLLRRYAAENDEAAFAELVRRHLDAVYSSALRRVGGDAHLAQDVAQQVFVALARKAAGMARHPVLSSWLFVTTRNEAANAVRAERRRKWREQEAQRMQEVSPDSDVAADWSRLAPVLESAMDDLSESDRRAVLMRFVERRSFVEIGLALRLSEDAARMRVDRALERLRPLLARRGVASTASALSVALMQHAVMAAPAGLASAVTGAAVAVGPAGALSLAAMVEFMGTTKTIAVAVGAMVVAVLGTATRQEIALHAAQDELLAANGDTERHARLLRDWRERLSVAERECNTLQGKLDAATAETAAAEQARQGAGGPTPRSGARPTPESIAAGKAFVARHPELQRAILEYYHASSTNAFGPFYQAHAFTSEQIERFENGLMGDAGVFRMIQGADGQLLVLSTPTWGDREKRREEEMQMFALLGADGMRDFQAYLRLLPARRIATQLAGDLYYTSAPLGAAQAEQLVAAIAQAGGGRGQDGDYDWDTIFSEAKQVLSETQLNALRAIRAARDFDRALAQAMRRVSVARSTGAQNP